MNDLFYLLLFGRSHSSVTRSFAVGSLSSLVRLSSSSTPLNLGLVGSSSSCKFLKSLKRYTDYQVLLAREGSDSIPSFISSNHFCLVLECNLSFGFLSLSLDLVLSPNSFRV